MTFLSEDVQAYLIAVIPSKWFLLFEADLNVIQLQFGSSATNSMWLFFVCFFFSCFDDVDPTRIIVPPLSLDVTTGQSLVLPCEVSSDSSLNPKFKWFFNGKAIDFSKQEHFEMIGKVFMAEDRCSRIILPLTFKQRKHILSYSIQWHLHDHMFTAHCKRQICEAGEEPKQQSWLHHRLSASMAPQTCLVIVKLLSHTQLLAAQSHKPDLPNLITDKIPTSTWFFLPSIMCFPWIYLVLPLPPLRSACDRLVNISDDFLTDVSENAQLMNERNENLKL